MLSRGTLKGQFSRLGYRALPPAPRPRRSHLAEVHGWHPRHCRRPLLRLWWDCLPSPPPRLKLVEAGVGSKIKGERRMGRIYSVELVRLYERPRRCCRQYHLPRRMPLRLNWSLYLCLYQMRVLLLLLMMMTMMMIHDSVGGGGDSGADKSNDDGELCTFSRICNRKN